MVKKINDFKPLKAIEYMNSYLLGLGCSSCKEDSLPELNFYSQNLEKVRKYYLDLQDEKFFSMEELKTRTKELQVMCNSCLKKKFNV